eukprot:2608435-Alexandrium_andersonii.AAC.1
MECTSVRGVRMHQRGPGGADMQAAARMKKPCREDALHVASQTVHDAGHMSPCRATRALPNGALTRMTRMTIE